MICLNKLRRSFFLIFFAMVVSSTPSRAAELRSPFPSCVAGTDIPNSHHVGDEAQVIRGMAPQSAADYQSLKDLGVKRILIFKNQTKREVADEITQLTELGYKRGRILHVPFLWKDHPDFVSACRQTVEALAWIESARLAGETTFFHCTVGEDRTGFLAGLLRFWWDQGTIDELFKKELCWNGYEAGNPQKPLNQVVMKIRASLTPLFVKIAFLLSTADSLDPDAICKADPSVQHEFINNWQHLQNQLRCSSSPRYPVRFSAAKACTF